MDHQFKQGFACEDDSRGRFKVKMHSEANVNTPQGVSDNVYH